MVSPAVGYAAAAMGHLACGAGDAMRVQDLARAVGAPAAYLSKIIHLLARKGLLETARGRGGGVRLAVEPRRVTLYELCVALDDDIVHPRCALGVAECTDERACPAHELQTGIRARQLAFLKSKTVQMIGEFNARQANARRGGKAGTARARKERQS